MDVLTSDGPQVGEELERSAERAALRSAVGRLAPRERRIMELRFGLNREAEHTPKRGGGRAGASRKVIFPGWKSGSSSVCGANWKPPAERRGGYVRTARVLRTK